MCSVTLRRHSPAPNHCVHKGILHKLHAGAKMLRNTAPDKSEAQIALSLSDEIARPEDEIYFCWCQVTLTLISPQLPQRKRQLQTSLQTLYSAHIVIKIAKYPLLINYTFKGCVFLHSIVRRHLASEACSELRSGEGLASCSQGHCRCHPK